MRVLLFLSLISYFVFLISSPCYANGITISPVYQYLDVATATGSARSALQNSLNPHADTVAPTSVELTNTTATPIELRFSLAHIQATDLLGRLQFNAPLPQTIIPASPARLDPDSSERAGGPTTANIATINPNELTLNPGEIATVSVTFNPKLIEPGKTAYLFLAEILSDPSLTPNPSSPNSNAAVHQYLGSTIIIRDPTTTIPKLELRNVEWDNFPVRFSLPDFFRLQVKNTGTAFAVPRGLIQITDLFNRELMRGPLNEQGAGILPNGERIIYARLSPSERTYPITFCRFNLVGYDDQRQSTFTASKHFLYVSPWLIPVVAIGLLLLRLLRSRWVNGVKRP